MPRIKCVEFLQLLVGLPLHLRVAQELLLVTLNWSHFDSLPDLTRFFSFI